MVSSCYARIRRCTAHEPWRAQQFAYDVGSIAKATRYRDSQDPKILVKLSVSMRGTGIRGNLCGLLGYGMVSGGRNNPYWVPMWEQILRLMQIWLRSAQVWCEACLRVEKLQAKLAVGVMKCLFIQINNQIVLGQCRCPFSSSVSSHIFLRL